MKQVDPAGQEKRLSLQTTAFGWGEQASFAPAPSPFDMQVCPLAQKRPFSQETESPGAKVMACAAAATESASRSLASIVVNVEAITHHFHTLSFLAAVAVSPSPRTSLSHGGAALLATADIDPGES